MIRATCSSVQSSTSDRGSQSSGFNIAGSGHILLPALCLAGVAFLCAGTASAYQSADLPHLLAQGTQALRSGDSAGAERAFSEAARQQPDSLPILNNLAIAQSRAGKTGVAIQTYEHALHLQPQDRITSHNLALAYFRAGRYRQALPLLQAFATEAPSFQVLDLTGLSLFALDRYSEAAKYFEQASALQPQNLPVLDELAQTYNKMKQRKKEADIFARIMKLDPDGAVAHMLMGKAEDEHGKEGDAEREYRLAEQADPSHNGVHSALGLVLLRENKMEEAEQELRMELDHFPNDAVSNCMLGGVLRRRNQPTAALPYLKKALEQAPDYREALFETGKSQVLLQQYDAALAPLRHAIQLDPNYYEAHFVLGTALRNLGQNSEAAREWQTAEKIQAAGRSANLANVSGAKFDPGPNQQTVR